MCGIAGVFNFKSGRPVVADDVIDVLRRFRYRGPDHLGFLCDGDLAVGNVRLAIQGLDPSGNQPVYNEDRSVFAVYNGEIYNFPELRARLEKKGHLFSTRTDTEVLVHLYEEYGEDLAGDLNGMFAFAVFDRNRRRLLLGRDRTAQKPLFLYRDSDGIFFSSELKAMLPRLPQPRLNLGSARTFLSMGYCLEPDSMIEGVVTLEPGTVLAIDKSGERKKVFFQPSTVYSEQTYRSIDDWADDADSVLQGAVERHLLSDVPITIFLSGGIDSSLLAMYLSHRGVIKTAYTGSFIDASDHDEYPYSRQLGEECGFDVIRVPLSRKHLTDRLDAFLASSSQPQGDYSGLATYCIAEAASASFKVVLGGDGADELFGGYPTYLYPALWKRYRYLPRAAITAAHAVAMRLFDRERYLSVPFKLQQLRQAWGLDAPEAHYYLKNFLPDSLDVLLLTPDFIAAAGSGNGLTAIRSAFKACVDVNPLKCLPSVDFGTFLRSGTIPKVERNTMAFSLENRLPYLDNEVLALSQRTPASFNIRGTETKRSLKHLLRRKLKGRSPYNPVKQGFSPPLRTMLDRELHEWRASTLEQSHGLFSPNLATTLRSLDKRGWDLHRLEWNICVLVDWCARNGISTI